MCGKIGPSRVSLPGRSCKLKTCTPNQGDRMSINCLTRQMRGLCASSSVKHKAFSSSSNGLSGQRLIHSTPTQKQAVAISPEIQCGKMKTRKAAAKRFSVTSTGKIRRRRPGKQHINEKMSRGKLRSLGKVQVVNKRDVANIAPNLPYSGVSQSRN